MLSFKHFRCLHRNVTKVHWCNKHIECKSSKIWVQVPGELSIRGTSLVNGFLTVTSENRRGDTSNVSTWIVIDDNQTIDKMVRRPGIEPGPPAWKAGILTTELTTRFS